MNRLNSVATRMGPDLRDAIEVMPGLGGVALWVKFLLRHEVASITVKPARAGLHPLFHQRFSTGMNKELPGQ